MTPQQIDAMKLALEALKWCHGGEPCGTSEAITALEEQLAEHAMQEVQRLGQEIEQEPVAWQWLGSAHFRKKLPKNADITAWNPLYTAPPQRKPLTDEQIFACENSIPDEIVSDRDWCIHFARAIEAKIKENT